MRILVLAVLATAFCVAQNTPLSDAERDRAVKLLDQEHKFLEAQPLLERLRAERPKDARVARCLGFALIVNSDFLPDPGARKAQRERGRKILLEAKALGEKDDLLEVLLQDMPEDGSPRVFSDREQVEKVMREAEAAFAKGDLQQALDGYVRVAVLEPKLYEAPLFAGDVYFRQKDYAQACEWYGRAVAVDPNRETAYRYWADALMTMGEPGQARSKIIEALIAEPYRGGSWMGARQWAARNKVSLAFPKIQAPHSVAAPSTGKDGKTHINVTIDPALLGGKDGPQDGRNAWFIYPMARAAWMSEKFAKEYPSEKNYRHSLKEEAEALRMVASDARGQVDKKKVKKLDPDLALLVKIDDAGLLEAYVLYGGADEGIAQDYAAYRAANREKLRRYLGEFVVPKLP